MNPARPLVAAVALLALSVAGLQGLPQPTASAATLADARAEASALRATLSALREQSAESILKLEHAEEELTQAVVASVSLSQDLDAARAQARGTDGQLRRRVSALYRSGGVVGLWATVLDARSPAEMVSRKANVDAVVAADARVRDTAVQGSGRLAALEQESQDNADVRARAAQVAQGEAEALTDSLEQQAALLAGVSERVRVLVEEQRLAAAAAEAGRLLREQAAARRVAAAALSSAVFSSGEPSSGAPSSGALGGPVQGAYAGPPAVCPVGPVHSFTDTWHAARSGGRKHQGTDVFAPHGSPAYAVVDGVVDKWSGGGLGGIALWLRGDDGTRYYYAHNAANVAPVGTRVRAGELVAYVGNTGNAETTPPHIHFEAHPRGGPAHNPHPWLAAICAG